ncbi:MAG: tRNA lysidine(34) synthetase TilS [Clostridia bacterium]|nr:tRNA lysidine(34) synthetase TilS [Clostridia bacterium]
MSDTLIHAEPSVGGFISEPGGRAESDPRTLPERVERFMLENDLLSEGAAVLVGLSGGSDSVALLTVLTRLAPRHGWQVRAAHFNHGIRGVGAEEDELFCRDLCEERGVPFYRETGDVPAYARENGMSIETAGRLLRYDFLERTARRIGAESVAVAHHMDDNAESILLHLARGSGLAGLTGIKPKRPGLIRPLLGVRKAHIEAFMEEEGLLYRTDETNLIAEGSRNRMRLDIVPYLEEHINPSIVPTLCSMAELLTRDEAYLADEAKRRLEEARAEGGFLRAKIAALPYPIMTRVIRMALAESGAVVDIERVHVESVAELLTARTGARVTLPGVEARTSYKLIKFGRTEKVEPFELPLHEGLISTPLGVFRVEKCEGTRGFVKSRTVAFMDEAKLSALGAPIVVRTRRGGDRIYPIGAPGRRKYKDLLIDRKVERERRDCIPVIACGQEVLFAPGLTASEAVKVDDKTAVMLRAEYFAPGEAENQ